MTDPKSDSLRDSNAEPNGASVTGPGPASMTDAGAVVASFQRDRVEAADALVLFGMTGDLAYTKVFRALYGMERRGVFNTHVVGVASSKLSDSELLDRIRKSLQAAGKSEVPEALRTLIERISYVSGDYSGPVIFIHL